MDSSGYTINWCLMVKHEFSTRVNRRPGAAYQIEDSCWRKMAWLHSKPRGLCGDSCSGICQNLYKMHHLSVPQEIPLHVLTHSPQGQDGQNHCLDLTLRSRR